MPSGEPISAGDPRFQQRVQRLADQVQSRTRYHSVALPDGSVLPGLQSVDHLRRRLDLFNLPADLRGRRVLDIGAWDGWFSFECERRGASVVAVDCVELSTFLEARALLNSKVEYLTLDVAELSPRRLGRFDIVLFFGVLYHLRHPLAGLERCVELSTDLALIESYVIAPEHRAIPAVMEYYERAELGGQIDNWCGPSPECLLSFCRSAGFAQADLLDVTNARASVICRRRWPDPPATPTAPAPLMVSAVENRTYQARFHPLKDEYLCCFFKSNETNLTGVSLYVEVDGYGTQTLVVAGDASSGWQANCLRPPGLEPGVHEVRLRTASSPLSNAVTFVMLDEHGRDVTAAHSALPSEAPELCSAELRLSGDLRYTSGRQGHLTCYFRSPAQTFAPSDVVIDLGSSEVAPREVSPQTVNSLGGGVWQANLLLRDALPPGAAVRVRLGKFQWSKPQCVVQP